MRRLSLICVAVFLGSSLRAENPQDIEFRLRLTKETHAYHAGESVALQIIYSTSSDKKYRRSSTSSLESVEVRLSPADGIVDLRNLRWEGGWAGSSIGSSGYLVSQPVIQQLDLCAWYRFQTPGHYSVLVISKEVSRVRTAEEGGGFEQVTLESNSVDFDILPFDPAWAAGELSDIEQALSKAEAPGEAAGAINRLALLDTPASVHKLIQLYLGASSEAAPEWPLASALRESSQITVIIPLLERALSDPSANIPSSLPTLLAGLQTRNELGPAAPYPTDPAMQPAWTAQSKKRPEVLAKYLARADTLLTESIARRTGSQRATAIYQAWYDAEFRGNTTPPAPEALSRLRFNVLAVANDLDYAQQLQFVTLAWQTMSREQLFPIIRRLATDTSAPHATYRNYYAFKFWCEGWPESCNSAILADVLESRVKTDKNVILLLTEAEHPELDKILERQLNDPATIQDSSQSQRSAALLLRAGSRKLAPSVDALLDELTEKRGCAEYLEGYLLGYLFRVAPENAGKRLTSEVMGRKDGCGGSVLRTLHNVRYSDDLIPIATKALDSPDLPTAHMAVVFLGEHGPASSEAALRRRLEALWNAWQERSSELQIHPMDFSADTKAQTAHLEQALASALSRAKNWKLDTAKLDRLRAGCLTEGCRQVADGKMSLNL